MRLLVTGASGFVGRELLTRLPATVDAIGLARETPAWAGSVPGIEWLEEDVTRPGFQRSLPGTLDAVVHLAQSRFDRRFPEGADDVVDVNVAATARLLDHARMAGAHRFVLASTATVYRRSKRALAEDAPMDTSSFYAASKRAAELLCEAYAPVVPVTVLRLFTTYGARQRGRLVADLIERVKTETPVTVEGTRGLVLSPVHVRDVADALLAACSPSEPRFEVVNVGGLEALGIADLAVEIGRALGRPAVIERTEGDDPGGLVADCTRMIARFPRLRPMPFADGLRLTLGDPEPERRSVRP